MDDRQVIALKTIRDAIVVPRSRFWLPGMLAAAGLPDDLSANLEFTLRAAEQL